MDPKEQFNREKAANIDALGKDRQTKASALKFMLDTAPHKYTYNFTWLGRPMIQYPQDIVAL
jgi:cephalosporin hydroxylase